MTYLAEKMHINRVSLSKMLNGNPTIETMGKIAKILEVSINELFYVEYQKNYKVSLTENDCIFSYSDDHVGMVAFLPHLTSRDRGSFNLSFKNYNFSCVPTSSDLRTLRDYKGSLEEFVYMGDHEENINIQFFSTFTTLTPAEHHSFCTAVELFLQYDQKYFEQNMSIMESLGFKRSEEGREFELGFFDREIWNKLIELTKVYDLDSKFKKKHEFERFNANGKSIIMFNMNTESRHNIKMWLTIDLEKSNDNEVLIKWYAPSFEDRRNIVSGITFSAQQSYDFLIKELIPRAKKLKSGSSFFSF